MGSKSYVVICIAYMVGVAILMLKPDVNSALIFSMFMNLVFIIILAFMDAKLTKHQKALKWFARHVRIDPKSVEEPMPESLVTLVEEEADRDDTDES